MRMHLAGVLLTVAILGACTPSDDEDNGDPVLRQISPEELSAAREDEDRKAAQYRAALATARVYRSKIRDFLIKYPERYRVSGAIALREFWHVADPSQDFRCIHPQNSIGRAERDQWQLVQCDQHSAYFLRGPVASESGTGSKGQAPTLEEAFEVMKISFGSTNLVKQKGIAPKRPASIREALPQIFQRPTEEDLAEAAIRMSDKDEVRVAYYDFRRRKEISVYDDVGQAVMTVIFRVGEEPALAGARGMKVNRNALVEIRSPQADLAEMRALLLRSDAYLAGIE